MSERDDDQNEELGVVELLEFLGETERRLFLCQCAERGLFKLVQSGTQIEQAFFDAIIAARGYAGGIVDTNMLTRYYSLSLNYLNRINPMSIPGLNAIAGATDPSLSSATASRLAYYCAGDDTKWQMDSLFSALSRR